MTAFEVLQKRRLSLLESIAKAADEISKIDEQLRSILDGKGKGGAA